MNRGLELVLSVVTSTLYAIGFAMPLVAPDIGSAMLVWVVAFAGIVACSGALERATPHAVRQLWSFELRMLAMGLQVVLDYCSPHLGDIVVLVGYALLVQLTLRMGSFPHARLIGARPRGVARRYLRALPKLLFVLPLIELVAHWGTGGYYELEKS